MLLWKGRVPLDANGRASVVVPLADALSSYKLVAVATAGGDQFGMGSTKIRTVQDLTIYSGVPPLVRTGEKVKAWLERNDDRRRREHLKHSRQENSFHCFTMLSLR